jgi:ABC-type branched-subunit amino acid transport system substrate-binding protein
VLGRVTETPHDFLRARSRGCGKRASDMAKVVEVQVRPANCPTRAVPLALPHARASPSSSASAKSLQQYAASALGLDPVYTNTSVDFGTSDVGPLVLGIKKSGANAAYLPLVASTNVAIIQGLQQNGVHMKGIVMPTGYGQDLLDQPIAPTLGPEDVFTSAWAPVELKTKATKQFQSDLKKYSGLTGVPDFGAYTGSTTVSARRLPGSRDASC